MSSAAAHRHKEEACVSCLALGVSDQVGCAQIDLCTKNMAPPDMEAAAARERRVAVMVAEAEPEPEPAEKGEIHVDAGADVDEEAEAEEEEEEVDTYGEAAAADCY